MSKKMVEELVIEHARIIFRNFAGKEGRFNPEGSRNFSVIIDEESAMALADQGWNIKQLKQRDPDDAPTYTLPVAVSYRFYPPKIYIISDGVKTELDEDMLDQLDYAEFDMIQLEDGSMAPNVDLVIRPYQYETAARSGIKAYLKKAYFNIRQDALDRKYKSVNADDEDVPF